MVEKGITVKDYGYCKWDVISGCFMTNIVALFIIVACAATIHVHGIKIETAKDSALALGPLAGKWARWLFALGLLNASLFSASILPLATAYFVCGGLRFRSRSEPFLERGAGVLMAFTLLIVIGAGVILIPNIPIPVMFWFRCQRGAPALCPHLHANLD